LIIAAGASAGGVWLWGNHHLHAGREALSHNQLAEAREHLRLYLKIRPEDGEAHFLAGRAARRSKDFTDAQKHFKECHRFQGGSLKLSMEQALVSLQQGELDRESYFLRQVDQGHPDSPLILEALVEGYMQAHRVHNAVACLARWEKLQPDNMYIYFLRGNIREQIPNLEPAASDYRKVLELNPRFEEARLHLANMLIELHDCQEALEHLQHLHEIQPRNTVVLVFMARCYIELSRPEEARQALAEALSLDEKNQAALRVSAQLAMQEGEAEQAEKLLRQALAIDPHEREANFLLAQCLRQRGKEAEADQQTARFKSIEADWQALHELFTVKISAAPHDAGLQSQVGTLLLRLGEEKAGVDWLKRALVTDPEHEPTRQALAGYYDRIGDARQAASYRSQKSEIRGPKSVPIPKS
jgi:Flp pilus assembly protein TadD